MLTFTLSSVDWDDAAVEGRLLRAGVRLVDQMRSELASLFGIATSASYTPRTRGCTGDAGRITLCSTGNHQAAYATARARFASRLTPGASLEGAIRNWEPSRQRICTFMNDGCNVGLTTISEGRPLISWKRFRTAGYYLNPFTYWLEQSAGSDHFSPALTGTDRALVTMGPTVCMLHETSHQLGCVYGNNEAGPCDGTSANPHHDPELATVVDTDIALAEHPDAARRGNYWGSDDPRSQPGGRYDLQARGEFVIWPSEQQLRTGLR